MDSKKSSQGTLHGKFHEHNEALYWTKCEDSEISRKDIDNCSIGLQSRLRFWEKAEDRSNELQSKSRGSVDTSTALLSVWGCQPLESGDFDGWAVVIMRNLLGLLGQRQRRPELKLPGQRPATNSGDFEPRQSPPGSLRPLCQSTRLPASNGNACHCCCGALRCSKSTRNRNVAMIEEIWQRWRVFFGRQLYCSILLP